MYTVSDATIFHDWAWAPGRHTTASAVKSNATIKCLYRFIVLIAFLFIFHTLPYRKST